MPVDQPNSAYKSMLSQWKRCSDVYDGQAAVHAAGEAYLPRLKDQDEHEYNAYVNRATFYNATYRTITGLVGMIFRKPPTLEMPPDILKLTDDIDLAGTPLQLQVQDITTEALKLGRIGLLVDYPAVLRDKANVPTLADVQGLNLRPTIQTYCADSIINWETGQVNNKTTLTMVVLKECALNRIDEFTTTEVDQWRVLDLFEGNYRVRIFVKGGDGEFTVQDEFSPLMAGKPLNFIPFQFIGTDDVTAEIDIPPLMDLVNLNLSHYMSTADLEHGAHFTGLPTPVISGYKPENPNEKFYIGSSYAWTFPDKDAKATYLEFLGTGLTALETRIEVKENQMAIMGARMLEKQKAGVETAESESIHRKGEESMLSAVSQTISLGYKTALGWFVTWAGGDPSAIEFELNRDFYVVVMDPTEITALVASWQQGAISYNTLFKNLQRGEIIDQDTTQEEEEAAIGDQAAVFADQQAKTAGMVAGAINDAKGGNDDPEAKEPAKKAA